MLRNLEVITVYEVRVARKQGDGSYGPYSSSALFQTLSAKAQQCVAEAVETTEQLASMSQQPLLMLQTGDRFQAGGGMEVTVVQASGSNGVFSGTGVVLIPWLGTRLEVVFQEVIINQDKQLVGGAVELRSESNVKELLAEIDKNNSKKEPPPPPPPPPGSEPIALTGTIAQVSVDQEAKQVSVQIARQAEPVLVSYAEGPVTIQDEAGNRYVVNEQGEVSQEAGAVATGDETQTGGSNESATNYTLMLSILDELEEAVNDWLAIEGKGPLDQAEMQSLASLPSGLPADALLLTHLSEHTFTKVKEAPTAFFQAIEASNGPAASQLAEDSAALSEEELAQAKQAVAEQLALTGLLDWLRDYLDDLGLEGACLEEGLAQAGPTYWQYVREGDINLAPVAALNKTMFTTLYCLTSQQNCPGQDYATQFGCGVAYALVQELDVVAMAEGITSLAEMMVKNSWQCLLEGGVIGGVVRAQSQEEALQAMMKCGLGVEASPKELVGLLDSVATYVGEHYTEAHLHGQATVFVLTIAIPAIKATRLRMLGRLQKLGGSADEMAKLFRAVESGSDLEIQRAIGAAAKGSLDGMTAKTKKLLDDWPIDTHNKFYDEVVDTELWEQVFRNAADQDGLVQAWKVLDETGIEGLTSKSDNVEIVNDFIKKYPGKADDLKTTLKEAFSAEDILQSVKRFDNLPIINNTDELIDVLRNVTDVNTLAQLEQKGIKSFFRGTTRSKANGALYPGNSNSQLKGISTSTDPIRGTIFAIESATANPNFKGVLQMGLPADLGNLKLTAPNSRVNIELEAVLKTSADNFSNLTKVEISVDDARRLVKEVFDIDLPSSISRAKSDELLKDINASNLNKSLEFYQKAIQYNTK